MTVLAFTQSRFSPADLAEFYEVAQPRLDRGIWGSVSRKTSATDDQLLVTSPFVDRPVFRFERDRRGTYILWFRDRDQWSSVSTGSSATECLSIWYTAQDRSTSNG